MTDKALFEASFVKHASLVDGTIRLTIDVTEERYRRMALDVCDKPGIPLVIARLTDESAKDSMVKENESQGKMFPTQPEGERPLSNQAFMLCKSPEFWAWINKVDDLADVHQEVDCDKYLKTEFGITSKSELDSDHKKAELFIVLRDRFRRYVNG